MSRNELAVGYRRKYDTPDYLRYEGLDSFYNGMALDRKLGSPAQFAYSLHVDFRKNPSQITILPGTSDPTNGIVADLVLDMVELPNGVHYAIGDKGNLYLIKTDGTWSNIGNIGQNGTAGIIYRADVDMVYITGTTKIARIKNATTATPQLQSNWFLGGTSTYNNLSTGDQAYKTGGLDQYTLKTYISEEEVDRRKFQPDISPLTKIGVDGLLPGTGDWTLTLHDDANTVLATSTVTNANVAGGGQTTFFPFSQVNVQVVPNARTYHFHLTSTVAVSAEIRTTTHESMVDCNFQIYADALFNTRNGLHPMDFILNNIVIGNGRYVTTYEPLQDNPTTADYLRHNLVLPPNFEATGFGQKDMMTVIAAGQRSTTGSFQDGAVFVWDGVQTGYNNWFKVTEGVPEGIGSHENVVWYTAGGQHYYLVGNSQPKKLRPIANTSSEFSSVSDNTQVYPHMTTVRRGILLMGYPSTTTNQSLEHIVRSFGSIAPEYKPSYGNSYTISTGTLTNNGSNNLKIGMVRNYNDTLYISWQDTVNGILKHGVDVVNNSSKPYPTWKLEALLFDLNEPFKYRYPAYVIATFDPLPTGATVQLKYRANRGYDDDGNPQDWIYQDQTTIAGAGERFTTMPIDRQTTSIEFGMEGTCGNTSPVITGLFVFFDPDFDERPLGDNGNG
jgi:hypothetical protein